MAIDAQKNLYVPNDAVLLDQNARTGHKEYVAPDCVVSYVEWIYGINRPLDVLINEYFGMLSQKNWELDPNFKPNKTNRYFYLRKGTQLTLEIYSITDPGRSPLTTVTPAKTPYMTIYSVTITYSDPASDVCRV